MVCWLCVWEIVGGSPRSDGVECHEANARRRSTTTQAKKATKRVLQNSAHVNPTAICAATSRARARGFGALGGCFLLDRLFPVLCGSGGSRCDLLSSLVFGLGLDGNFLSIGARGRFRGCRWRIFGCGCHVGSSNGWECLQS